MFVYLIVIVIYTASSFLIHTDKFRLQCNRHDNLRLWLLRYDSKNSLMDESCESSASNGLCRACLKSKIDSMNGWQRREGDVRE